MTQNGDIAPEVVAELAALRQSIDERIASANGSDAS